MRFPYVLVIFCVLSCSCNRSPSGDWTTHANSTSGGQGVEWQVRVAPSRAYANVRVQQRGIPFVCSTSGSGAYLCDIDSLISYSPWAIHVTVTTGDPLARDLCMDRGEVTSVLFLRNGVEQPTHIGHASQGCYYYSE